MPPTASPSRSVTSSFFASSLIFADRRSAAGCHEVRITVRSGNERRSAKSTLGADSAIDMVAADPITFGSARSGSEGVALGRVVPGRGCITLSFTAADEGTLGRLIGGEGRETCGGEEGGAISARGSSLISGTSAFATCTAFVASKAFGGVGVFRVVGVVGVVGVVEMFRDGPGADTRARSPENRSGRGRAATIGSAETDCGEVGGGGKGTGAAFAS